MPLQPSLKPCPPVDHTQAERVEHRREAGELCEHGVWRCKVCAPHETHRFKPRDAVKAKEATLMTSDE